MKYWDELNDLESKISALLGARDVLKLITDGLQDRSVDACLASGLYCVADVIDTSTEDIFACFSELFAVIRADTHKDPDFVAPKKAKKVPAKKKQPS